MQHIESSVQAKQAMRRELLERRDRQTPGERRLRGLAIEASVLALPDVARAKTIFCFISHGSEVPTHTLIDHLLAAGKVVLAPVITRGMPMQAATFKGWENLVPGPLGILAPADPAPHAGIVDLVLTPGVGFSPRGERLGYGRGYYDRWFASHAHGIRVGLGFQCQMRDTLPTDRHDVRLHRVITESGIQDCDGQD